MRLCALLLLSGVFWLLEGNILSRHLDTRLLHIFYLIT